MPPKIKHFDKNALLYVTLWSLGPHKVWLPSDPLKEHSQFNGYQPCSSNVKLYFPLLNIKQYIRPPHYGKIPFLINVSFIGLTFNSVKSRKKAKINRPVSFCFLFILDLHISLVRTGISMLKSKNNKRFEVIHMGVAHWPRHCPVV